MIAKIIIVLFMLAILASLASAALFLIKQKPGEEKLVKALTLRIGLSILLFCLLMFCFAMGWLRPHG